MSDHQDGNAQVAYTRWELPQVDDPSQRKEEVVTVEEIETIQKRAHQEGYQRGHQEGLAAARGKAQKLDQLMRKLDEPFTELDQQVEQELLLLATSIARQLVRRELKTDPGQIVAVVREAMAALPVTSRNARLHLHPEDAALVREILSLEEAENPWKVVDDPVLQRGDCRVVTETSKIDATLEARLTALITSVLGGDRGHDEPRNA
jgi:flagellar assembly protein FliH